MHHTAILHHILHHVTHSWSYTIDLVELVAEELTEPTPVEWSKEMVRIDISVDRRRVVKRPRVGNMCLYTTISDIIVG
jgi:hypothetical protein